MLIEDFSISVFSDLVFTHHVYMHTNIPVFAVTSEDNTLSKPFAGLMKMNIPLLLQLCVYSKYCREKQFSRWISLLLRKRHCKTAVMLLPLWTLVATLFSLLQNYRSTLLSYHRSKSRSVSGFNMVGYHFNNKRCTFQHSIFMIFTHTHVITWFLCCFIAIY